MVRSTWLTTFPKNEINKKIWSNPTHTQEEQIQVALLSDLSLPLGFASTKQWQHTALTLFYHSANLLKEQDSKLFFSFPLVR